MTTVTVTSGVCGFSLTIKAEKGEGRKICVTLDTKCEMVRAMSGDLAVLDPLEAITGFMNNPVFRSASKHLRHSACPVPAAILKAVEVEAGMNVPRDVEIRFVKEQKA